MDQMPLNFVIICGIPEAIIIIYIGLYLLGIKPSTKRVVIAGILQGIALYFVKKHTGYGESFIYQTIIMLLITCIIVRVKLLCSFMGSVIGILINILVESAYILTVLPIISYTYVEILSRDWLRVFFTLPKQMILLLIIRILVKKKYTLEEEFRFISRINGQMEN